MDVLIDAIPDATFHERHVRVVDAPPELVWDALMQLCWADLRITKVLAGIRSFGRARAGAAAAEKDAVGTAREGPCARAADASGGADDDPRRQAGLPSSQDTIAEGPSRPSFSARRSPMSVPR